MKSQVRVGIVVRPLVKSEVEVGAETVIKVAGSNKVKILLGKTIPEYEFDCVYGPANGVGSVTTVNNGKVLFEDMVQPLVEHALNGYNATVFAYGQTGSGKMLGIDSNYIVTRYESLKCNVSYFHLKGKTFTMGTGVSTACISSLGDEDMGIVPLAVKNIFDKKRELEAATERCDCDVWIVKPL